MHRMLTLCTVALFVSCTTVAAQDRAAGIADTLAALPALPLLTSEACLDGVTLPIPAAEQDAAEAATLGAPYVQPFDMAAAQITADVVTNALETNDNTREFATEIPTATAEAFFDIRGFIEGRGLNPDNIVDISAFYLVALSTLDQNNFFFVGDLETIVALRDQIAVGEANCRLIASAIADTPALAPYLVAHMLILFKTLEKAEGTPDLGPAQAAARELFGAQLAGRALTPRDGLQ